MAVAEAQSVGRVETQIAGIGLPAGGFRLECGQSLPELQIAYETYGSLTQARDNVIFVCHALSGDAHAAGHYDDPEKTRGWWDDMIGPGKGIDTSHYFVICANILGGCKGTTGPSSINPATGKPYGSAFPRITIGDIVDAHLRLLQHLGIEQVAATVGGSMGGMQVLDWAIRHPATARHCICIAAGTSLSAQALAFDVVGRGAITSDPNWHGGDYYETGQTPAAGLAQARQIGHITYLSRHMMSAKFGRERRDSDAGSVPVDDGERGFRSDFQVGSYLEYQGEKFVGRFDANSYLHIARAMDEYDLVERFGSLDAAFSPIQAKTLVVALSEDWLFPPEQSVEISHALLRAGKHVSYCRLHAPHGHDAFLVDIKHLSEAIRAFLPWVKHADRQASPAQPRVLPEVLGNATVSELSVLCNMVWGGERILDLGCGDGWLLSKLTAGDTAHGLGVDIDIEHVIRVIDKGHDAFQSDIDAGLAMIPDRQYDYAILSETLQVVRKPRFVLREMLRVAGAGIVSFPNFGKWTHRLHLWCRGRMPKGGALPFEWYDTPNIHLFTLRDFVSLCREEGIHILDIACIPSGRCGAALVRMGLCNLGAERVLVKISREKGAGAVRKRCRSI